MQASHIVKTMHSSFLACLYQRGGARRLLGRCIYSRADSSKLMDAYELVISKNRLAASEVDRIFEVLREVRGSTVSTKEAYMALRICLQTGYLEPELLRSCLSVVEVGYFSPVSIEGWSSEPTNTPKDKAKLPKNCFEAINELSIENKASLVAWQDKLMHLHSTKKVAKEPNTSHTTRDIDPEKRELFTTKKLGKVVDTKPLRVRIRKMHPGKKLCNTVAMQLREATMGASLSELGSICLIFASRFPLSGQLNDDTIHMLVSRLNEFTPEELGSIIPQIAILASAASARSYEVWSFLRANENKATSESHRLYNIRRQTLDKHFLEKIRKAVVVYSKGVQDTEYVGNGTGKVLGQLDKQMNTLRLLAASDVPLDPTLWDSLVHKVSELIKEGTEIPLPTLLSFFEALDYAQFYTPKTIEMTKILFSSFKDEESPEEYEGDTKRAFTQALYIVSTYSLGEQAKGLLERINGIPLDWKGSSLSHIKLTSPPPPA